MDFLRIEYHDQVPWAADAFKTEFGSVANLSSYGIYFFRNLEYCDSSVKSVMIYFHIWYSYQVQCIAHTGKIAFCSVPS